MEIQKRARTAVLFSVLLAAALGAGGTRVARALEIGKPAPDFTLPSTTGEKISLSQFRGKLVLIEFYGGAFFPVWTANLSARRADYGKFQELNVEILGISADNPFAQKTFADSLKLPYPLLSDFPDLKVIRRYGILGASKMTANRSFFLVDQQGIVRKQWLLGAAGGEMVMPSEEILKAVREIRGKP
jgi:thioredoxin-dependent peroxiredoxin